MAPKPPTVPGVFTFGLESACLNEDISLDELCPCIKCLQRGKSPGIDGIVANMFKDGGDLVNGCLLWLVNCMLVSHFPKHLSVGFVTAIYKSGDKSDVSNFRGITVGLQYASLSCLQQFLSR